jgi:small-conductance mechanosensitive channel/CRP-like cAMP-binding protein
VEAIVDPRWLDVLRGGVPALALLIGSAVVIHALCRRAPLRRLGLALQLVALAASLELFHYLVRDTDWLAPYAHTLALFAALYTAFKIGEVVVCDVVAVRRGRNQPPSILRDVTSALFAAFVLILLLRATLGWDVTALVATSAAVSIVLGLAMQETLANLFAGLALMIERPFEPGDWVRFGDRVGRVTEVSWRAVKLRLIRAEDYLVVPNSVVAKHEIVNLSQPTPLHGQTLDVPVVLTEPPNRVRQALIEAALQVDGVLSDPLPRAGVLRFEPGAVYYRLTYWIQDFSRALDIEGQVPTHIWYAFRRAGIRLPFPVSDVRWRDAALTETSEQQAELGRLGGLLRGVDFLAALTSEEVERLAAGARLAPYPAGMTVVRQGDAGDSLFVIASGRVEVSAHSVVGRGDRMLATLGAGDYFGEMSLLTGAPRSATCRSLEDAELLILTADALRPLLTHDPAAAERLSQAMARRKAHDEETVPVVAAGMAPAPPDLPHVLLGRMRNFFGLTGAGA